MRTPTSLCFALTLCASVPAHALAPLEVFVRSALQHNTDAQEAQARVAGQRADVGTQRSRLLPGIHLEGSFTENQYNFGFPVGSQVRAVQQQHQLDGQAVLKVPLIDLSQFARHSQARHLLDARGHDVAHTRLAVSRQVAQTYYQLVANRALAAAAQRALEIAIASLGITQAKADTGEATQLEVHRGRAAVAAAQRQVAESGLDVAMQARALSTLSGLTPTDEGPVELALDPLHEEAPADTYLAAAHHVPALSGARATRLGAERQLRAEHLRLVPALSGRFTERFSSATAYAQGSHQSYAAMVVLSWDVDLGNHSGHHKAKSDAQIARIQERRALEKAQDDIYDAWHTVSANIARVRAARAEAAASSEAAKTAADRYASELTTQLDMLQAQRDSFSAEAALIKANTDLLNARVQLRLCAGQPLETDAAAQESESP